MEHEPHLPGLIQADLDEVVAGAERAEVDVVVGLFEFGQFGDEAAKARGQRFPHRVDAGGRALPGAFVAPAAAAGAAVGYGAFDGEAQAVEAVGQVGGGECGAHGHHAAADVYADRGGNDGADRGDHAADGRALAQMHIGHHRQMLVDDGQAGGVDELCAGGGLDGHAVRP